MRITIGNQTEKLMRIIGINEYPFTEEQLKINYRALLFKYHPDHNNSNEAEKKTRKIIDAYKNLLPLSINIKLFILPPSASPILDNLLISLINP